MKKKEKEKEIKNKNKKRTGLIITAGVFMAIAVVSMLLTRRSPFNILRGPYGFLLQLSVPLEHASFCVLFVMLVVMLFNAGVVKRVLLRLISFIGVGVTLAALVTAVLPLINYGVRPLFWAPDTAMILIMLLIFGALLLIMGLSLVKNPKRISVMALITAVISLGAFAYSVWHILTGQYTSTVILLLLGYYIRMFTIPVASFLFSLLFFVLGRKSEAWKNSIG